MNSIGLTKHPAPRTPLNPNADVFVPQKMRDSLLPNKPIQDQAYYSAESSHSSFDASPEPTTAPVNPVTNQQLVPMDQQPQHHRSYWCPGSDKLLPGGTHRMLDVQPVSVCGSLTVFLEDQGPTPVQYLPQPELVKLLMNSMHEVLILGSEYDQKLHENTELRQALEEATSNLKQSQYQIEDLKNTIVGLQKQVKATTKTKVNAATNTNIFVKPKSLTISTQVYMTDLLTEQQILDCLKPDETALETGKQNIEENQKFSKTSDMLKTTVLKGTPSVETRDTADANIAVSSEPVSTSHEVKKVEPLKPKRKVKVKTKPSSEDKPIQLAFKIESNFEKWTRDLARKSENNKAEQNISKPSKPTDKEECTEKETTLSNRNSSKKLKKLGKKSNSANTNLCSGSKVQSSSKIKSTISDSTSSLKHVAVSKFKENIATPLAVVHVQNETLKVLNVETKKSSETPPSFETSEATNKIAENVETLSPVAVDSSLAASIPIEEETLEKTSENIEIEKNAATTLETIPGTSTSNETTSDKQQSTILNMQSTSVPSDNQFVPEVSHNLEVLAPVCNKTTKTKTQLSPSTSTESTFVASNHHADENNAEPKLASSPAKLSSSDNPTVVETEKEETPKKQPGEIKMAREEVIPVANNNVANKPSTSSRALTIKSKKADKKAKDTKEKEQAQIEKRKKDEEAIRIAMQENQDAAIMRVSLLKYFLYIQKVRYTHFGFVKDRPLQQNKLQRECIEFWENNLPSLANMEPTAKHLKLPQVLKDRIERYKQSSDQEERKLYHLFLNIQSCMGESAFRKVVLQDMLFLLLTENAPPERKFTDYDYFNMVKDFEIWKQESFEATPVKKVDIFSKIDVKYINHLVTFINIQARKRNTVGAKLTVFSETQCTDKKILCAYNDAVQNLEFWGEAKCTTFMETRIAELVEKEIKTVDEEMFIGFYDTFMGFRSDVISIDMYLLWNMVAILEKYEERRWTVEATFMKCWFGYETKRKLKYLKQPDDNIYSR